ncbi:ABC-2 transporter permease [Neobittarella massiliensis]|uniref:ABC-2 transporter permease n=1 Tax=Neobittarella massiliensis (ex Bilen et al. 2018) TaxID=2041842 RepID=A0A8J6IQ90_9FIRM|nr:ABC-2 transporter permease [Neobittarella massiliensis]MBC3516068.1 ABC-2 transporter permease [Neobittarella massiliensis]
MKGLILKDIYIFGSNIKLYIIYFAFFGVFSFFSDASFFYGIVMMMLTLLSITAASYDDMAHWPRFAVSMPLSRGQIVTARYLFMFIMTGSAAVLLSIFNVVFSFFKTGISLIEGFAVIGATGSVGLLAGFVILPILYKMGAERARILMILVMMVPYAALMLANALGVKLPAWLMHMPPAVYVALVLALLVGGGLISFGVSRNIFEKKDL